MRILSLIVRTSLGGDRAESLVLRRWEWLLSCYLCPSGSMPGLNYGSLLKSCVREYVRGIWYAGVVIFAYRWFLEFSPFSLVLFSEFKLLDLSISRVFSGVYQIFLVSKLNKIKIIVP